MGFAQGGEIERMEGLRCYRPLIIGRRGAVAANHPLAAQAGLLALRAGGNAVRGAAAPAPGLPGGQSMKSGGARGGVFFVFYPPRPAFPGFQTDGPSAAPRNTR